MIYPVTFTFSEINAHLALMLSNGSLDPDLLNSETNEILDITSETTQMSSFREALIDRGITINDDLWLTSRDNPPLDLMSISIRDPLSISAASSLTDAIFSEYEGEANTTYWEDLNLGGDDSVDYCSSYLDALWLILADMTKD